MVRLKLKLRTSLIPLIGSFSFDAMTQQNTTQVEADSYADCELMLICAQMS